jgi:hypothetical protein
MDSKKEEEKKEETFEDFNQDIEISDDLPF